MFGQINCEYMLTHQIICFLSNDICFVGKPKYIFFYWFTLSTSAVLDVSKCLFIWTIFKEVDAQNPQVYLGISLRVNEKLINLRWKWPECKMYNKKNKH